MIVDDEMVRVAHAEYHKVLGDKNRSDPMRAALEAALAAMWRPFIPHEWHNKGSCYPCVISTPEGWSVPCDPWTLPHDNDYAGWLAHPLAPLPPPPQQEGK